MILHCVFCDVEDDAAATAVMEELSEFALGLPGIGSFDHGPNRDFENKSPNHAAGFVMRCADEAALNHYAQHPTHKALGARLVAACRGGADGIMVFDIETP